MDTLISVGVSAAFLWSLYALFLGGAGELATDTTSLYPAAAQKTPKVGYLRQLSAEGVLSLKPDAIIATNTSALSVTEIATGRS